MTEEYRLANLTEARTKKDAALALYRASKTTRAKNAAMTEYEFWLNKVSHLSTKGPF